MAVIAQNEYYKIEDLWPTLTARRIEWFSFEQRIILRGARVVQDE
jgi:hypothetical protein